TTPWDSSNLTLQKRPEWLHRHGFRLHPMHIDPQTVNNLGAGRKCHNTAMMIPERTVERLIKKYPEAKAKICCNFTTLLDSDIINTIYFYVAIEVEKFKIRITQKIDAFEKNPQFVKASDMASIVGILCMMIQNIAPLSIRRVSVLSNMPAIARFPSALFSNNSLSAVNRKREREEIVVKKELPEEKDDAALNNSEIALLLASL
ncbi:MAG: hypothetical protein NTZ67_04970, partial [Gammaproteobacteria bacterium]|nr:hypothetical protein [Gammaproteobacteria bacterium]